MQFQTVNLDALKSTLDLIVGPQATDVVAKTYVAFEAAMQAAYDNGYAEGYVRGDKDAEVVAKLDAEQNIEERIDAAFDNGFMAGQAQAEEAAENQYLAGVQDAGVRANCGFDDGYLEGVRDARLRPRVADETIEQIIADQAKFAINGEYDVCGAETDWDSVDEYYGRD